MNAEDIAKKIDALTIEELVQESRRQDGPIQGGDYDTMNGWMRRLGLSNYYAIQRVISYMIDNGLAEEVNGFVVQSNGLRKGKLIHSPALSAKVK